MEHTVYILLSRSGSVASRMIHFFISGDYTHASIGLDGPSGYFYSFARKYPRWPLPGGFVRERAGTGFFALHPGTPCCLYALTVSKETYLQIRERLALMYACREDYHYSLLGAVACYFRLPFVRRKYYFCSHFVAEVLTESGAACLPYVPAATRPMDFLSLKRLRKIHQGEVHTLEKAG